MNKRLRSLGDFSIGRRTTVSVFGGAKARTTDHSFRHTSAVLASIAGVAEETDYDNFKSEVARHQARAGAAYEHSLHEVWSVMNRLQK
jgi:hypothetical protein